MKRNKWEGWGLSPKGVMDEVRKLKADMKHGVSHISISKWSLENGYETEKPVWGRMMKAKKGESLEDALVGRLFDLSVGLWQIERVSQCLGGVEIGVCECSKGMPESNITVGVIKSIVGLTK